MKLACGGDFFRQFFLLEGPSALFRARILGLEMPPYFRRDELGQAAIIVRVTAPAGAVAVDAPRNEKIQFVFCACHGHVEQAALLLDGTRRRGFARWNATVDRIQNPDGTPLLTFRGMNCRKNGAFVVR